MACELNSGFVNFTRKKNWINIKPELSLLGESVNNTPKNLKVDESAYNTLENL